mmetsp:Transcript_25817/g.61596  ORF Transcript_25817/g.61596 Transcript_25817/m.61596 type:complete len:299 (-) Transcript_25817:1439-2335(-)
MLPFSSITPLLGCTPCGARSFFGSADGPMLYRICRFCLTTSERHCPRNAASKCTARSALCPGWRSMSVGSTMKGGPVDLMLHWSGRGDAFLTDTTFSCMVSIEAGLSGEKENTKSRFGDENSHCGSVKSADTVISTQTRLSFSILLLQKRRSVKRPTFLLTPITLMIADAPGSTFTGSLDPFTSTRKVSDTTSSESSVLRIFPPLSSTFLSAASFKVANVSSAVWLNQESICAFGPLLTKVMFFLAIRVVHWYPMSTLGWAPSSKPAVQRVVPVPFATSGTLSSAPSVTIRQSSSLNC